MARNASPERDVQRAVIRWLRLVLPTGSVVASVVNEQRGAGATAVQRARYGMARKASGVVSGFPDAVAVLPEGRSIWLEFKAPGSGILSDAQLGVHDRLRSLGHAVGVVTCIETCRGLMQALDVPLREASGQATAVARVRVAKARMPKDRLPA